MNFSSRLLLFTLFFILLFTIILFEKSSTPPYISSPSNTPTPSLTPQVQGTTTTSCHINGILPDPNCTPGAIDPRVTQENIHETICIPGYTKTVRPPVEYTNQLKRQQIQEYGYADTDPRHYEEDHIISLELGGSPDDPKNLWPEPGASPNPKDDIENRCHRQICNGQINLQEAQKEISTYWPTACQ